MNKLFEIYKTLDDWDLIKTDKGVIGLVLNGYIHSQSPINLNDSIIEIKSSSIDLNKLWDNIPSDEDDSVFVGVSYEANPNDLADIKTQYKNIIEYNDFQALEENNKKLITAKDHIIIPPLDFCNNHIIGRGLLCQIKERSNAGKSSNVYVEGEVFPIKNVYELKGNDYTKAAVVVF